MLRMILKRLCTGEGGTGGRAGEQEAALRVWMLALFACRELMGVLATCYAYLACDNTWDFCFAWVMAGRE